MVRKEDYSRMGGLDDRFFAHMEEIDLCWRLQLEDRGIWVVPQSVVWHVGGGTLSNDSPWKLKLNFRNDLLMLDNNLAKTYSLDFAKRMSPDKAAARACRKASRTIRTRMVLDGLSAAVYLLSGRADYFRSVVTAHKEFRQNRHGTDVAAVKDYILSHKDVEAPALFPRWIVPLALFKGNGIFAFLRSKI